MHGARRDGRRPSQKLPSTAICCHLVAAKSLHLFQPFHFCSCPSRACRPSLGPGLRTASGATRSLGDKLSNNATCPMAAESGTSEPKNRKTRTANPVRRHREQFNRSSLQPCESIVGLSFGGSFVTAWPECQARLPFSVEITKCAFRPRFWVIR
jgi:hypothetical protein